MRGATAAEWKALVYCYRGPGVGNGVRVLLLYLADRMRANRTVSVPRSTIARDLGISASEVTQRIKAARDAGLLDTVVQASPHVTAVYAGQFPAPVRGTGPTSEVTSGSPQHPPVWGTGNPTSKPPVRGNPEVSPNSKRSARNAVVCTTPSEGSTAAAPRQSRDVFIEDENIPHPSMIDEVDRETVLIDEVDRETRRAQRTRRALIDALQASASERYINEDTADLLNEFADGLGDWARYKWSLPPDAATNRYLAGKQLNLLLNTWKEAVA